MSQLPPYPWHELATKDDIAQLWGAVNDLRAETTALRGDVSALGPEMHGAITELGGDMNALGTELRDDITELRGESAQIRGTLVEQRGEFKGELGDLKIAIARQTWIMVTGIVAAVGVTAGIVNVL